MTAFLTILIILFFFSWHERDNLIWNPHRTLFPKWAWYTENRYKTRSWWLKNVTTMFLDGIHFYGAVTRFIGFYLFAEVFRSMNYYASWSTTILVAIGLFTVFGGLHSLLNGGLFKLTEYK